MAYPAYDAYNPPLSYPNRQSMYGEYAYTDPVVGGAYGETYAQPYPIYAQRTASQYAGVQSYDNVDLRDAYHPLDRALSTGPYGRPRYRRSNSMSYRSRTPGLDGYRHLSSSLIKFKRKGGLRSGITLGEAMSNARLSNNDSYSLYDLNADHRGRIILRVRWTGYTTMTYELPVDSYDGRLELQTLARRVARACVHFLQANMIPISWDRVILYHLEEISPGTWQPVLSTS